jgi:DNA polymerase-3 subunit delta'
MARIASALQERWHVPPDEAQRLAHLADGRLGWALQAQQTPELLQERDERMALLNETIGGTRVARFALAEKLAKEPEVLPQILQVWLTWWRDLALLAWGRDGGRVVNVDRQAEMQALARQWQHEQIIIALQHTREALWQLAHNANTRLVLENLFLCYPQENGNR